MIKTKYVDILQAQLHTTLAQLANEKGKTEAVFNLLRLTRQLKKIMTEAGELHVKLASEFFVTDENGQFVPHPQATPLCPYQVKDGKETEFMQKIEEFLALEIEVQSYPVDLKDFPNFMPTASQLAALSPILAPEDQAPGPGLSLV
jgi:hypothetical protein